MLTQRTQQRHVYVVAEKQPSITMSTVHVKLGSFHYRQHHIWDAVWASCGACPHKTHWLPVCHSWWHSSSWPKLKLPPCYAADTETCVMARNANAMKVRCHHILKLCLITQSCLHDLPCNLCSCISCKAHMCEQSVAVKSKCR